jgi:hypothetical protein
MEISFFFFKLKICFFDFLLHLKVSNLLLDHMGGLKLTDYGIHKKISGNVMLHIILILSELLDNSKTSKDVDYW